MVKNMSKWFFTGMGVVALIAVSVSCGPLHGGSGPGDTALVADAPATTAPPLANDPFGPPESTPEAPQTPPDTTIEQPPATAAPPAPVPPEAPSGAASAQVASEQLGSLVVNDNFNGQPAYDRDKFKHWSDLDKNGCTSREDVLIRQDLYGKPQVDPFGCKVVAGDWFSEYDGITFTQPGELDVDHMVPLAEGWRAGAWQWDGPKRERFANDLDSRQLIAVSASTNRSKSDKRPDQWMPPRPEFRCQYLFDWVSVKHLWELTVTNSEKTFIGRELATC